MRILCVGLILWCCLGHTLVWAARPPVHAYGTTEGMPHDRVMRVRQDERGFLWFATADGLARFDGLSIVRYGAADGLTDPLVWDVLPGTEAYWIATDTVGLFRFRPAASPARFEPMPIEGRETTVYSLLRDGMGVVWAATGRGLYRGASSGEELRWSRVPLNGGAEPERRSIALAEDLTGSVWVGGGDGLRRVCRDGRVIDHTAAMAGRVVTVLSVAIDGDRVLAAGESGIAALTLPPQCGDAARSLPEDNRRLSALDFEGTPIRSVLRSSSGDLWIGGAGKLVRTGPSGFVIDDETSQDVADATVRSFLEDRFGNIWAATDVGGALCFPPSGFTTFLTKHGLASNYASRLQVDTSNKREPGSIIATSRVAYFTRIEGDQAVRSSSPLPGPLMERSLYQYPLLDHRGEWWLPTTDGVWRFARTPHFEDLGRAKPIKIYRRRDGLPGDAAEYVWEDAGHSVWILNNSSTEPWLTRWDRETQRFQQIDLSRAGSGAIAVNAMATGSGEDVWLLLSSGALVRWRGGSLRIFATPELAAMKPSVLHRGPTGTLWIGGRVAGIAKFEDTQSEQPEIRALELTKPLASVGITCLVEANDGKLFVGTRRGVYSFDTTTGRQRHYTVAEGLGSNEIVTCTRDADGRLWFAALSGISRFEPGDDLPLPQPDVYIASLRAGGVSVPIAALGAQSAGPLTLGPDATSLEVSLLSVGLAPGERARFQYRLEQDWSSPTELSDVVLAGLAPGKHRVELRALNAASVPSPRPVVIEVNVLAPLWKRPWARAFIASGLLILGALGYRVRVRGLVQRERTTQLDTANRELERRVQEGIERLRQSERMAAYGQMVAGVAHEVRHPVFALRTAAYMILQKGAPGLEAPLAALRTETDRISRLVDELLVFAREPSVVRSPTDVARLLEEVATSCRVVHGEDGPSIVVEAATALAPVSLDHDRITQVLVNLVENARRHGEARTIRLVADRSTDGRQLVLAVTDDGRGIQAEMVPHLFEPFFTGGRGTGLGLAIAERLIQAHGGTIAVDSQPGRGARFTIYLPLTHGAMQ